MGITKDLGTESVPVRKEAEILSITILPKSREIMVEYNIKRYIGTDLVGEKLGSWQADYDQWEASAAGQEIKAATLAELDKPVPGQA